MNKPCFYSLNIIAQRFMKYVAYTTIKFNIVSISY